MVTRPRSEDNNLSPEEMQQWLKEEIYGISKAAQLRLQEAVDFVNEYARGKLSPDEATERLMRYESRWDDSPIPGVLLDSNMTDQQILDGMDRYRLTERQRRSGGPTR